MWLANGDMYWVRITEDRGNKQERSWSLTPAILIQPEKPTKSEYNLQVLTTQHEDNARESKDLVSFWLHSPAITPYNICLPAAPL